ncbi:Na(+)/H(+) antiporter subunit B [Ornithinibacillus bavariensis]|uniref:Na(+)/H(+) antiporter subunit B n=1 Tax=Ornithinibacillus bavariensis TaxID=545502 RepID=A0A919X4E6_9BACI|nr:Na(+)/H(+) antiporter subunit B [Ornithinibacillus bavariensis]GIO25474.1 Na(+)/H(+) antiporter subunit B [Ornithinibacillus bavariensis]HAM80578.1 Na(+)/H(+) antiporter subunit B [Ornithinibacillus sp.]
MKPEPNDVILHTVTKIASIIIFTFSIDLFWAGHHYPGGGFIGGLTTAAGIVLLYLSFDIEKIRKNLPIDYKKMAALGVLISVFTGLVGMIYGDNFLEQAFGYFNLPVFGKTELATAVLFDIGVALAVIGTAVTIITSISEDEL